MCVFRLSLRPTSFERAVFAGMAGWDEGATTYTYQGFRADEEDDRVDALSSNHGAYSSSMQ